MATPRLEPDEVKAAVEVLESGSLRQGSVTRAFEEAFADFVSSTHAYACSSGTAALHLAFLSVLQPGDEVLVPSFTFFATASTVVLAGGIPVFCDVDPDTYLIDLEDAETRITDKTRAITPVYLFGQPMDSDALNTFAAQTNLTVVGDAAQSLGTRWSGSSSGKDATLATYSFYPTKNLFVGEGGMVTTDDEELDRLGRLYRSHGQGPKYHHSLVGLNYRMTDVEAAIGLAQLPKVESRGARRRWVAARYDEAFRAVPGLDVPASAGSEAHHSYHAYTLRVDPSLLGSRDAFRAELLKRGTESQVNYPLPLHHQQAFSKLPAVQDLTLPHAERLCGEVLSIPVHHHLTDEDVGRVIDSVLDVASSTSPR